MHTGHCLAVVMPPSPLALQGDLAWRKRDGEPHGPWGDAARWERVGAKLTQGQKSPL